MEYKYTAPEKIGMRKVKLSKKDHNELFKRRKRRIFDHYDYYVGEDTFLMERTLSWFSIIIYTLILPFVCLASLIECKNTFNDWKSLFKQKEKGKHISNIIYSNSDLFGEILDRIK